MPKKKTQKQNVILSPENYIRQRSRNLPVHECWITAGWEKEKLASIVISRKHASGNITYCIYLADLACLGVKDTGYRYNDHEDDYEDFLENMKGELQVEKVSYDLVHNIIFASLEFAEEYGFEPHKDFKSVTQYFLEEDTEDIPLIEIDCGDDGKPLYVNSGHESQARVNQILKQLEKTAGKGNFHYIIPEDDYDEYDEYDDGEYDEEDEEESKITKIKESLYNEDRDELKKRFFDLMNEKEKNDGFKENDFEQLIAISEILIEDITDPTVIDNYYTLLEDKLTTEPVYLDDELPNTLFEGIQNIDGEELSDMFYDTLDAIHENKKASKAIADFRETVGDVPAAYYLEIYFLLYNKKKKYIHKLEEAYQKYPNYFLFKMLFLEAFYVARKDENDLELFETMLLREEEITEYELSEFIIKYAIHSYKIYEEFSFEKYVALENFINDNNSVGTSTMVLMINIQLTKILELMKYLKKDDE